MSHFILSKKTQFFLSLGLLLVSVPSEVLACSTCYSADPRSLWAYYGTTLGLTVIPLILCAALIGWVYKTLAKEE